MTDVTGFRGLQAGDAYRVRDAFMSDAREMSRQGDVRDLASARAYVDRMLSNPDARRRGITSRLVRAPADRELGEGGLYRLELGYRANTRGSAAVAHAAGFVREGLERGKFLVDGERIDVITASRLKTDPA